MVTYPLDAPLPATLPVREALHAYLAENGFSTEEYDAKKVRLSFWGVRFTLPNPASRQLAVRFHDLHHVMTGYGTDPAGEFEISAWEMRRGIGVFGNYVRLIIVSGTLSGFLIYPRRAWAAWKRARSAPRLPEPSLLLYDELLGLSVGALRERYGVPEAGIAGGRTLHENAPQPDGLGSVGRGPVATAE